MNIFYIVFVNEKLVWRKKVSRKLIKEYECWEKWIIWRFHRKTPMLESVFNKIAGVQAYNFMKRRLQHKCFPVKKTEFLRTTILKNIWKKKEHLPTTASCLTEAKYAFAINCYMCWNQLYISTMVLQKWFRDLPEVFFSSFFSFIFIF